MERFSKTLDPVFTLVRWLTVVLLTVMVAVESYEIAMREFTGDTPHWSKELVLLCMVWMGCMGSAVLHRERGHITLEFLVDRMSPTARRWIMTGGEVLIFLFSMVLLVSGAVLVREFIDQTLPGTAMPVGLSYLPLPVTGLLLVLASAEHILRGVRGRAEEDPDAA